MSAAARCQTRKAAESEGGRSVAGIGHGLLVLFLTVYLAASSSLGGYLWSRGEHATPEQWAYHLVLARLGVHHHHGSAASAPSRSDDPSTAAPAVAALPPGASELVLVPGACVPLPDYVWYHLPSVWAPLVLATAGRVATADTARRPTALPPEPPERPPSFAG